MVFFLNLSSIYHSVGAATRPAERSQAVVLHDGGGGGWTEDDNEFYF